MAKKDFQAELLKSDEFAQYSLRASFFLRKLRGMKLWEAIDEVQRLQSAANGFPWKDREKWGIDNAAWEETDQARINPLLIFCHPRLLKEQPHLLLYYRTVALISQKGLAALVGGNVAKVEGGESTNVSDAWLSQTVVALNSIVSSLIVTAADLLPKHLAGLQFASAGATIQGSWNNAVGSEGEAVIRTILLNHLQSEISQVVLRSNKSLDYQLGNPAFHAELIDRVGEIKIIRLKQGYHVVFASEPDVSLRNSNDLPVLAVEVKAGSDSAGALERLGAAMKSFEHERNQNPRLKTVYVVRAMTPEVRKRIDENSPFDYTFGLTELLHQERTQRTFANLLLRRVLGKD